MYCAYDHHGADLPGALDTALDQCLEKHADSRFYALIDCAFAPREVAALLALAQWQAAASLYAGTLLADFEELSPILAPLPRDTAERHGAIARWLALCDGKPMLSFIASGLSIADLKRHFSAFLQVRDDDKKRYPLRFADVCMTPAILACLHPEQKRAWLGGMHGWWIIARDGTLRCLGGTDAPPVAAMPNEWHDQHIGDAQLIRLSEKNEADSLLSYLHDLMPGAFAQVRPSEIHQKTAKLLEQLDRQHIDERVARLERVIPLLKT